MNFVYFDAKQAIFIHDEIINKSGGILGILNIGLLESTLEHVQNDFYYPTLENKVTHLFFSINKNHCFQDGNKRSSIILAAYFIKINGYNFLDIMFILFLNRFSVKL